MSRGGSSPTGSGGGMFSGFIARAARSLVDAAVNSSTASNSSSGVTTSRSFFSLGSDSIDSGSGPSQITEYTGKSVNNEIAEIYPISLRAGDLILHGPCKSPQSLSTVYPLYNIILHATNSASSSERMFSIFRTESESEASRMFIIYREIFPALVKASLSSLDKNNLEKIIKVANQNPSYQAVHVAAALNMVEQLKSHILREKFMEQEGNLLHTPLHVAVMHGRIDAFRIVAEDDQIFKRIYDYIDVKGNSVVHLAADCKNKAVGVAVLKLLKERLQMQSGQQLLSANRMLLDLFQRRNNEGYAPIHLACINHNPEAVEELTSILDTSKSPSPGVHSELLDMKATKTGNTPLHLATGNPTLVSHLLELGSDPNVVDNDGVTALHKAVQQTNLKSTIHFLTNNAYPNCVATFDTHNEATPLHVAAATCAIDCLKALVVFGADLEMKNSYGQSARHIVASVFGGGIALKNEALFVLAAAGAKRCGPGTGGCAEGCKAGGKYDGKKPDNWKILKDGTTNPSGSGSSSAGGLLEDVMKGLSIVKESFDTEKLKERDNAMGNSSGGGPVVGGRLLALDGGGIRGLVLTQMLFFMEKEFGNAGSNVPIISYFDWVAGTSTGGILALALACGKSVLETQSLYMKLKDRVFTGDRPYTAARMEDFLKREFGQETKMSSIQKPRVMIMTSLANRRPPDLYIFRNYISPGCLLGENEEFTQFPDETFVWETAKVTGAAPSYFTLDNEMFIDGGLISNNPTLDALSELVQFKAVMSYSQQERCNFDANNTWKLPAVVLSLGTGIPPRVHSAATDLDIAWPTGVFDAIKNVPKLTQLVNLLIDQATQAEGQVVERARAWCTSIGVPYFRFSPQMSSDIGLDEKQDDVLVNLMWETWCYMVGNRGMIREIFERLKALDISNTNQAEKMDVQ